HPTPPPRPAPARTGRGARAEGPRPAPPPERREKEKGRGRGAGARPGGGGHRGLDRPQLERRGLERVAEGDPATHPSGGVAGEGERGRCAMKCLSLRHPWCHLVLFYGKSIENRKWNTAFRGEF